MSAARRRERGIQNRNGTDGALPDSRAADRAADSRPGRNPNHARHDAADDDGRNDDDSARNTARFDTDRRHVQNGYVSDIATATSAAAATNHDTAAPDYDD